MIACMFSKVGLATVAATLLSSLVALPAHALQCAKETFERTSFVVCTVDPARSDLRLYWKSAGGKPYRTFSNLAETLQGQGRSLNFAVNAGMYQTDFSPLGLFIENGEELRPADTTSIEGPPKQVPNFYKKPNGIFFWRGNCRRSAHGRVSKNATGRPLCDPIGPDAGHRKRTAPCAHTRLFRQDTPKWRRRLRQWSDTVRDQRSKRQFS